MDGFQRRLNSSIRFRLTYYLSLFISLIALLASLLSFAASFYKAQELQDDVLYQVATLIVHGIKGWDIPDSGIVLADDDYDSWVYVQRLGGIKKNPIGNMPIVADDIADGFHTIQSQQDRYRVFVKTTATGAKIAISQETSTRNKVAYISTIYTLLPFLILLPLLLFIVHFLLRKAFDLIQLISTKLDQRTEYDLSPISEPQVIIEIQPFVFAINRLLKRVEESISLQRQFVANAAHELRSPLTAISLQAENLEQQITAEQAMMRLRELRAGIERERKLLEQLLSLSKVQMSDVPETYPVSVVKVFKEVMVELLPQAKHKKIDLGVLSSQDCLVMFNEFDLFTVIKNLVDNAIRYTQVGGKVDLACLIHGNCVVITVSDNGPGITQHEHSNIFRPFYRILGSNQIGSGLGLAIVKATLEKYGASYEVDYADKKEKSGLAFSIAIAKPMT